MRRPATGETTGRGSAVPCFGLLLVSRPSNRQKRFSETCFTKSSSFRFVFSSLSHLRWGNLGDLLSPAAVRGTSRLLETWPGSRVRNPVEKGHNLPDYQIVPLAIKIKLGRI